jgi:protein-S-isoprenylcysteine O-methyltransferase Ste14
MQASAFEFRYRFFVLALIFFFGYQIGAVLGPRLTTAETLANWSGHPTLNGARFFFSVGAFIIAFAASLRTWATAYLHGDVVHDMAMHSNQLVAAGPYRYLRNPLYLGTILLSTGIGMLYNWVGWLLIVGGMIFFNLRLIAREELGLLEAQGEAFQNFKAAVPSLIPSLTPRLPAASQRPRWPQAWLAESFMWALAAALALFALTLNSAVLYIMMFGTLGVYAILHVAMSRRKQRTAATRA